MKIKKIEIEHQLKSTSRNIVWQLIGTADGLRKWIADDVKLEGDTLTFTGYYYDRDTKQIEEIGKTAVSNFNYRLMVILLSTLIPGTAVAGTGVGLGVHFGLKKKKAKISA